MNGGDFYFIGNILRGVQCTYSHSYGTFSSPLIYAGYEKSYNQVKETCTTINLQRDGSNNNSFF